MGERGGSFHLLYVYITGNAPIMEARVDESISVSSVGWKLIYRPVGEKNVYLHVGTTKGSNPVCVMQLQVSEHNESLLNDSRDIVGEMNLEI